MYLVNPMYFISNVIYIIPERSYILIEKSCWNTIVHLIFKRRKPSLADIRSLKHLCYSVYVTYMGTGRVDYKFFNSQIALLQDKEKEFEVFQRKATIVVPDSSIVELETNEENFFYEDEFIKNSDSTTTSLLTEDDHAEINKVLSLRSGLSAKLEESINYFLALSPQTKNLVDLIGYGRLLSLFKVFLSSKELSFKNKYEYQFFKLIPELIAKACRTFNYSNFFYCNICYSINCHDKWKFSGFKTMSEFQECHIGQIDYYIDFQPINKVTITMSQSEIDTSVIQPDISVPTDNISKVFDVQFPVHELLTIQDTHLKIKAKIFDIDHDIHIFRTTDVRKILKDITFSYLFTLDILSSPVFKEVETACFGFDKTFKNTFIRLVLFEWCKVYKIDTSYLSSYLHYQHENRTHQEMIDFFQNSTSNEQSVQVVQTNFDAAINDLINQNLTGFQGF